jgi:hypothetical protein
MKTQQVTRKELYDLVWSKTLAKLTEEYAYTNEGIKKICKEFDVPMPDNGYWSKLKFDSNIQKTKLNPVFNKEDKIELTIREQGNLENVDQTPLTRRTKEIESNAKAPLIVPEKLINPDILIQNTKKIFEIRKKDRYYRDEKIDAIHMPVEEKNFDRALLIMDTFIKLLKFRGHSFKRDHNNWGPHINVNDVLFSFAMREKNKRIPGTKLYESSTYVPTGILVLKIGESYKAMEWSDGATKLEKQLAKIVAKIESEAQIELEWREECRLHEIKRKEEEKIRKEYEVRKELEFDKTKELFKAAEYHNKAKMIREYIDNIELQATKKKNLTPELKEWLKWAKDKVDWLDPLLNKEDNLLTEKDKQKLFSENKASNNYFKF